MRYKAIINKFNRGEVSPMIMARDDVDQVNNSCERMENFMPIRMGPMVTRPGFEYIGAAINNSAVKRALIPLTRSTGDTVLFEFADDTMRPLSNGLPYTASANTVVIADGGFSTNSWTSSSAAHNSSLGSGYTIYPTGYIHKQATGVTSFTLQTYRITVAVAPITVKIGPSPLSSTYYEDVLYPGVHYVQFTPTTTSYYITLKNENASLHFDAKDPPDSLVTECQGLTTGELTFTVPDIDYRKVSYDASADVMFLAMGKYHAPRSIRRVGDASFSWEEYYFYNGPYNTINTSAVYANVSKLSRMSYIVMDDATTSEDPKVFAAGRDEGRLIKVVQLEQQFEESLASLNAVTSVVLVSGDGEARELIIDVSGTFSGTLRVEKSPNGIDWSSTGLPTYTGANAEIITDNSDGEDRYYRIKMTAYTSGSATVKLTHVNPNVYGEAKINRVLSSTQVYGYDNKQFMSDSINITNSVYWYLGTWHYGTYPQGVTVYEGRVAWVSGNRIDLTVTDDYYNFDRTIEGDSAAITRTLGFGPVDDIAWVESTNRLFLGLPHTEVLVRSTNFDEPLTPLNTNLKGGKGLGSSAVRAVASDGDIYFVSRDGKRLHRLAHDTASDRQTAEDMMMLHPEVCSPSIDSLAVTKHPESRLWALVDDELRVLLHDATENVQAWSRVTMADGLVMDVCAVPSQGEDELWALVDEGGYGDSILRLGSFADVIPLDWYKRYISSGTTTLTGLDHLEGEDVYAMAGNDYLGPYEVVSGQITLPQVYFDVIVGVPFESSYTTGRLSGYMPNSVLGERKRVTNAFVLMTDYVPGMVSVGKDIGSDAAIPMLDQASTLNTDYFEERFGVAGDCTTDSRLSIRSTGPCKVLALGYQVNTQEKSDKVNTVG